VAMHCKTCNEHIAGPQAACCALQLASSQRPTLNLIQACNTPDEQITHCTIDKSTASKCNTPVRCGWGSHAPTTRGPKRARGGAGCFGT